MDVNDVFDFMEETSTPAEPSSKEEKEEESDLLQLLENTVYVQIKCHVFVQAVQENEQALMCEF